MNESKFCVDCKHCREGTLSTLCESPKNATKVDLVTGKSESVQCRYARISMLAGFCGPEAKFFEPKRYGDD